MGPSWRDQCVSKIARIRFCDHAVSKSVVVTPRSGGSNVGMRGHDVGHISFPILG